MKKDLRWRLKDLPDASSIADLVSEKVITKEEARKLLFNEEKSNKVKELEEEVKFLRELVDKLTDQKSWKVIEKVYRDYTPLWPYWYKRYEPIFSPHPSYYTVSQGATTVTTGNLMGQNMQSANLTTTTSGTRPSFSSLNK